MFWTGCPVNDGVLWEKALACLLVRPRNLWTAEGLILYPGASCRPGLSASILCQFATRSVVSLSAFPATPPAAVLGETLPAGPLPLDRAFTSWSHRS